VGMYAFHLRDIRQLRKRRSNPAIDRTTHLTVTTSCNAASGHAALDTSPTGLQGAVP
jgi:hypothetical protein